MARYRGSISVDVDVSDLLEQIDDDDLRAEAQERFGAAAIDTDLLSDIEEQLLRHKPNAALALIDNYRRQQQVPDSVRAKQLAEMRVAGAA